MNEIIKYKNEMQTVAFSGFSEQDLNIFMALCARMKDKGTQEITFDYSTLRSILEYPRAKTNKQFTQELERMSDRLLGLRCKFSKDGTVTKFVLFPKFSYNANLCTLTVSVEPEFAFLLNDFTAGGYTQMELKRFIKIKGKYAKTIYRYLRQFRATGYWRISYEDFRDILAIPATYKPYNINQKVLKPAIEELQKYFPELKCEPFYLPKQGAPLGGYTFTFIGENDVPGQISIDEVTTKTVKKINKNKFKNFEERTYDFDELEKKLLNSEPKKKSR